MLPVRLIKPCLTLFRRVQGLLSMPVALLQETSESWLHFVDEAVKFERELAPLKGLPAEEDDSTGGGQHLRPQCGALKRTSEGFLGIRG